MSKEDAFESALAAIRKQHGADAIMSMAGNDVKRFEIDWVSTGCLSLDKVLGGGLPRGRMMEIFGAPSGGKSVLSLFLMAQIQRLGGKAVLVDSEFTFSPAFASKIGVDVDKMLLVQAANGEQALDIVAKLVEASAVDIIVIDSVASLVPKAEVEGEITDVNMALQARMLSKACRMLAGAISKSKTIVIFINQVRQNIGQFYGPKTVSPGGTALKFFSSIRLEVYKGKNITEGEDKTDNVIGNWINVTVRKNKCAPPFKECELELIYEKGLDLVGDVLDSAVKAEILTKQGNSIFFGEVKLGGGREQAKKFLQDPENKKVLADISKKVAK